MANNEFSLPPLRILFVCLGNICRSPMAEGVFRHVVRRAGAKHLFTLDSAGLGSWHIGQPPDERAQAAARERGIDISDQRARQIGARDFERFDLIIAMDRSNRQRLLRLAPEGQRHKIKLLLDYAPQLGIHDVPDPFFGGPEGFDYVLQLVDVASRGLLHKLMTQHQATSPAS